MWGWWGGPVRADEIWGGLKEKQWPRNEGAETHRRDSWGEEGLADHKGKREFPVKLGGKGESKVVLCFPVGSHSGWKDSVGRKGEFKATRTRLTIAEPSSVWSPELLLNDRLMLDNLSRILTQCGLYTSYPEWLGREVFQIYDFFFDFGIFSCIEHDILRLEPKSKHAIYLCFT